MSANEPEATGERGVMISPVQANTGMQDRQVPPPLVAVGAS